MNKKNEPDQYLKWVTTSNLTFMFQIKKSSANSKYELFI